MKITDTKSFILPVIVCFLLAIARGTTAQTSTTAPCVLGYTVGFFNGVWNSEADAMIGLNALKQSVEETTGNSDDTYNHEDVGYQLFYNHTGSAVGSNGWQDVAEVFQQRQNELDPSGYFSTNHLYMVWEELNGGGNASYLTYAGQQNTAFSNFVNTVTGELATEFAGNIGYLTSNPPTAADYATQNAELDALATAGRKLLLIAHSQGNLFVNQAYDHVQPEVGSTRVKAVHVAPASPTLRGQWVLSDLDIVINGLRAQGGSSAVAANNIHIVFASSDPSGHTLVGTYLDTTSGRTNGRQTTEQLELSGLQALTAPSNCAVSVSPANNNLQPGGSVTLTATIKPPPTDPILYTEYTWTITGSVGGSFTTATGSATTTTTTANTITYNLPANAQTQTIDTVTVKVQATKTQGDLVNAVDLGSGTATVSVLKVQVTLSPSTISINSNQTASLNAVVTGTSQPGSYKWSTAGTNGKLSGTATTGAVTAQTSFCSTSPAVTYTPSPPSSASSGSTVQDTISVQVFADAACGATSGNAALASASGSVVTTVVKDVSAWIGTWSSCMSNNPNANFYLAVYGKPFPTRPNEYDSGSGADLFFEVRSSNGGVSYGFIDVVATDTTLGFDDRFRAYNDALSNGYAVFSNKGGVFSSTVGGNLYFSCTR